MTVPLKHERDALQSLRAEHVELMRRRLAEGALPSADIEAFTNRVCASGQVVYGDAERDTAQAILDFWNAVLVADPAMANPPRGEIDPFDAIAAPDLSDVACPFMGLKAFDEADSERFRGRETAIVELLDKLATERLVIVHGASGGGKSSLVAAGVVPRLRAGAIPGSEKWTYLPFVTPGADPLAQLRRVLPPEASQAETIAIQAGKEPDLPAAKDEIFLFIDQFEELFTLVDESAARSAFADEIVRRVTQPTPGLRVIVAVREDFRAETIKLLGVDDASDAVRSFNPRSLTRDELRQAIIEPAAAVGLVFDDGLVDQLIESVADSAAALPLLQFTLAQLWTHKARNRITWNAYEKVGTPDEALAIVADDVFNGLPLEEDRACAKRVLTTLVVPAKAGTESAEFVRCRLLRETLHSIEAPERVDEVIRRFVDAGLLRLTPGQIPGEDRVEVAHEALIRNWPRLVAWNEERRSEFGRKRELASAARAWLDTGRLREDLKTGEALIEAEKLDVRTPEVREFLAASRAENGRRKTIGWSQVAGVALGILALVGVSTQWSQSSKEARDFDIIANARSNELQVAERNEARLSTAVVAGSSADARARLAEQVLREIVLRNPSLVADLPPSLRDLARPAIPYDFGRVIVPYTPGLTTGALDVADRFRTPRYANLSYTHYRMVFDKERGVPVFAASNFDRAMRPAQREPRGIYRDTRASGQLEDLRLAEKRLSRTQLVGWQEVVWGDAAEQKAAGRAVNAMTNAIPIELSRDGATLAATWAEAGAWMQFRHNPGAQRVTIISGSILAPDAARLAPTQLWKIAVSRVQGSSLPVIDAAILPARQRPATAGDLPGRASVREIERLAALDFGRLRLLDPRSNSAAVALPPSSRPPTADSATVSKPDAPRIFVHYRDMPAADANAIRDILRAEGFSSPETDLISDPRARFGRDVRYFFAPDAAAAQRAIEIVGPILTKLGHGDAPIKTVAVHPSRFPTARPGTIEIWLTGTARAGRSKY